MVKSKVDDVVLSLSLRIKTSNATIVKVESDSRALLRRYRCPQLRMTTYILYHQHRLLTAKREQVGEVCARRSDDKVRGCCEILCQYRLPTACLHVFPRSDEVEDNGRLEVIGQPKIESAQLSALPAISSSQSSISIVWPMLVDHVAHKAIVRGRLDAETPTMADAPQPYYCLLKSVHLTDHSKMPADLSLLMSTSSFRAVVFTGTKSTVQGAPFCTG